MGKGGGGGGYEPPPITESERTEARISAQKWNDFVNRYMPVEQELRDRVDNMDTADARRLSVNPYISKGTAKGGELALANAMKQAAGVTSNQNYLGELADPLTQGTASGLLKSKENYYSQAKALADLGSDISNQSMGQFSSLAKGARDEANQIYANNVADDIAQSQLRTSTLTAAMNAGTSYGMEKYVRPRLRAEALSAMGTQPRKSLESHGIPYRR